MFESVKNFLNRGDQQNNDRQKLESEAKNFKLPSEWFPQLLKIVFFTGLAILNYRLFSHVIPGAWGVGTGIVAIAAESVAIYALHNFSRSAGGFRFTLGAAGLVTAAFSIVHGTFSILDLIHVAELSGRIEYYSRVVAFPLLAVIVGVSVIAITMTHPINLVRFKQALAHTQIVTGRAQAASELELMRAQSIVESARLDRQRERIRRESEYLAEVEKLIAVEQKKRQMVASISDPELRETLARELGVEVPKAAVIAPSSPASSVPVVQPRAASTSNWRGKGTEREL